MLVTVVGVGWCVGRQAGCGGGEWCEEARNLEDAGWCWEKGDAGRRAVDLMGSVGEVSDAG